VAEFQMLTLRNSAEISKLNRHFFSSGTAGWNREHV